MSHSVRQQTRQQPKPRRQTRPTTELSVETRRALTLPVMLILNKARFLCRACKKQLPNQHVAPQAGWTGSSHWNNTIVVLMEAVKEIYEFIQLPAPQSMKVRLQQINTKCCRASCSFSCGQCGSFQFVGEIVTSASTG